MGDVVDGAGPDVDLLIVKIDIEGFEAEVFASADEWIREPIGLYVEIHDWMLPLQHTSTAVLRAVLPLGRDMLISRENLLFVG